MIDEPPGRFLMTPAQHCQWAPAARHQMQEHTSLICAATMSTVELLVVERRKKKPRVEGG